MLKAVSLSVALSVPLAWLLEEPVERHRRVTVAPSAVLEAGPLVNADGAMARVYARQRWTDTG